MSFIPHTPTDIRGMLDSIGIETIDALFEHIPARYRDNAALNLASPKSEHEVREHLDRKSTRLNSSHIQKSRMPSSA